MKSVSVFLSHNSKDKEFVRMLAAHLEAVGVRTWIDEAEIKVGDSLLAKIADGVQKSDFVAAILSSNSITSPWVQKELAMAMTQEIQGRRVKVLPIVIDQCEIPLFLRDKLYADFTSSWKFDGAFDNLLRAIEIPSDDGKTWKDRIQRTVKSFISSFDLSDLKGRVLMTEDGTVVGLVEAVEIGNWRILVRPPKGWTRSQQLDDPIVENLRVSTNKPSDFPASPMVTAEGT